MVIFHSYVTLPEGIWAFLTALYPKHPFDPHMMTGRSTVIHLFLHRGMFLIFSGHCQKLCCKFCLRLASTMAKVTIKCNLRKDSRSLCRCHMPLPSAWSKSLWPKPCDCSKATDGRVSSSSWRYQAACSLPPSSCHLLSVLNSESVGICCSLLRFLEILDIEVVLGPATEAPDRMTRNTVGKTMAMRTGHGPAVEACDVLLTIWEMTSELSTGSTGIHSSFPFRAFHCPVKWSQALVAQLLRSPLWRTGDLNSGRRLANGKSTSTTQVTSPSQSTESFLVPAISSEYGSVSTPQKCHSEKVPWRRKIV